MGGYIPSIHSEVVSSETKSYRIERQAQEALALKSLGGTGFWLGLKCRKVNSFATFSWEDGSLFDYNGFTGCG